MENFQKDDILRVLLHQYMPVVMKIKSKYYVQEMLDDDWIQEALIVLNKCYDNYDATKNVTFGVLFKTSFERTIISKIRKENALKRVPPQKVYSFDDEVGKHILEKLELKKIQNEEELTLRMIVCEHIMNCEENFSELERHILCKRLLNQTIEEIACELHCSERMVRITYNQVTKKIRKELY